jgi:hypothetical protein
MPPGWRGILKSAHAEIAQLRAAAAPFLRYYDDIRFNLRRQPRPSDAAVSEMGERCPVITWAEFYALRDAFRDEQKLDADEKQVFDAALRRSVKPVEDKR